MTQKAEIEQSIITFPEGLAGLGECKRFVLVRPEGLDPLLLLQSVDSEQVCLPVAPVKAVKRDYELSMPESDRDALQLPPEAADENLLCLTVIVLPGSSSPATCNLLAPIVINPEARLGRQVLQLESGYPAEFPLPLK